MTIIRVWLYKAFQVPEGEMDVLTKRSHMATRVVVGDFQYFKVDRTNSSIHVLRSSRKEAKAWSKRLGQSCELYLGYPDFMIDLGYKL